MSKKLEHLSASDKEIYDLLVSSKQRMTEGVLRELARNRGIFYSNRESREELAEKLSILPHDYFDVADLIDRRQSAVRTEKTTTVTLQATITTDDLKSVLGGYKHDIGSAEKVKFNTAGTNAVVMEVDYNEFDFSKTRLAQRQQKDARLEFAVGPSGTTVRMPATDKARSILANLQNRIGELKKQDVPTDQIEVSILKSAELRTKFFTTLIAKLPGYTYRTVTSLKVAPSKVETEDGEALVLDVDGEDDADDDVSADMLSFVKSVALSGQNLVVTPEYRQLLDRGFFVTSITWQADLNASPYHRMRFEAGFEQGAAGTGFRYGVRYAPRNKEGGYASTFRPVESLERDQHLQAIESFAREVVAALIAEQEAADKPAPTSAKAGAGA